MTALSGRGCIAYDEVEPVLLADFCNRSYMLSFPIEQFNHYAHNKIKKYPFFLNINGQLFSLYVDCWVVDQYATIFKVFIGNYHKQKIYE